jgi:hypothetical protein
MKIVLTGSIAFDYLMRFPGYFKDHILPEHLEKISLSFLVEDMVRQYGGVGANIAYTLALLGEKPLLFSTAGQDFPEYGRRLEQIGVDVSGVRVSDTKFTASFFVNTDLSNAQIARFIPARWQTRPIYRSQKRARSPGIMWSTRQRPARDGSLHQRSQRTRFALHLRPWAANHSHGRGRAARGHSERARAVCERIRI